MAEEKLNPEMEPETPAVETPVEETTQKPDKKAKKAKKGGAADLAAAETRAEEAEKKAGDIQEALMRTAAEYDNFRKRSQKERDAAFNDGVTHAVLEMLPVIDTLEAAANAETADEEYKKGVILTLNQCVDIFTKLGITEIECLGGPFDPELHDAVMQQPAEGVEPGCVSQVIRKGYTLGERVVRHAMVCVAPQ